MSADEVLRFADVESLQDLATLVSRARALDGDGAIRLQAAGDVLAAWVCVLPGRGILGHGVVLALRVMPLAGPHRLDVTVALGAVTDRLARRQSTGDVSAEVSVPSTAVTAPWTALTPPRSGWEVVGDLDADALVDVARDGIAEVAQGVPEGSGAQAVQALRARVWGRSIAPGLPAGAAFAAYGLGFTRPGEQALVRRLGAWTRLSLPAGHVLSR